MPKKKANGEGTIRKRNNGTWEARVSIGGKQKSIYGSTQSEVRKKMTAIIAQCDSGEYVSPSSTTVEQWLQTWKRDYWNGLAQSTQRRYDDAIRLHIMPHIGNVTLSKLSAPAVQHMCNRLIEEGLSAKTVSMIHGTLHTAIEKAVKLDIIKRNVCDYSELPRTAKKEMHLLTDENLPRFLAACHGDDYEHLFFVDIFTGLRLGEISGLSWDCIDFERGTIRVYRQLQKERKAGGVYRFTATKNGKQRIIQPAPEVMDTLKHVKAKQAAWRVRCGGAWENSMNLVFTNQLGGHLSSVTIREHFKKIVTALELPEVRFHDLRHTFATLSLQNGTDVKTVSESLGHATVAFTMDRYGHVSDMMRKNAANRMSTLIKAL